MCYSKIEVGNYKAKINKGGHEIEIGCCIEDDGYFFDTTFDKTIGIKIKVDHDTQKMTTLSIVSTNSSDDITFNLTKQKDLRFNLNYNQIINAIGRAEELSSILSQNTQKDGKRDFDKIRQDVIDFFTKIPSDNNDFSLTMVKPTKPSNIIQPNNGSNKSSKQKHVQKDHDALTLIKKYWWVGVLFLLAIVAIPIIIIKFYSDEQ